MIDLALWPQWEEPKTAPLDAREGMPRIWSVQLYRQDGRKGPLNPGAPMTIDMLFAGLHDSVSWLQVRVWVTDEERVVAVAETGTRVYSPNGMLLLHANLQLGLNHGRYNLCCSMWNKGEARAIEPIWTFPLEVK